MDPRHACEGQGSSLRRSGLQKEDQFGIGCPAWQVGCRSASCQWSGRPAASAARAAGGPTASPPCLKRTPIFWSSPQAVNEEELSFSTMFAPCSFLDDCNSGEPVSRK